MLLFEILEKLIVRLWPIWVLLLVMTAWRGWFRHVRAESEEAVTRASRRRWRLGFYIAAAILAVAYVDMVVVGRPQHGTYRPAQLQPDGTLTPGHLDPAEK